MNLGRLEQVAQAASEKIRDLETKLGEARARIVEVEQARPVHLERTQVEDIVDNLEEAVKPATGPVPVPAPPIERAEG